MEFDSSTAGVVISQNTSYGSVTLIGTHNVYKNYESSQELDDDISRMRKEFMTISREDENSDLPIKMYRIHSAADSSTMEITIKSKTRLGALITFMDHDQERITKNREDLEGLGLWYHLVGEHRGDNLKHYLNDMVNRMIFLVEVQDETIMFGLE